MTLKWFLNFLFLLLPIWVFSQTEKPLKNGIGVHLTNDGLTGTGISMRYSRQISDQGILKFEFEANAIGDYSGRIGYEFVQLRLQQFELGMGLDLKYRHINAMRYGLPNFDELAFEIPIELRYHISRKYTIQAGLSISRRIRSNETAQTNFRSENELRLGVLYRF